MTETEAKTRWCPFARPAGENRWPNGDDFPLAANCLASVYMAWRWKGIVRRDGTDSGYCGLAANRDGAD